MNTLLFLVAACLTPGDPMQPLQARETVVDRGNIKAGVPLSQTFSLTNQGPAALTIAEVRTGCGCLRPRIAKKSLQPGESTDLSVEINTLAQNSGPALWKVTARYRSETGQPQIGELELQVKATVFREINVEPVALFIASEHEATHDIFVTDRRSKPLTIKSVRCESNHVKLQVMNVGVNAEGQRTQQVQVTVLENCPQGHFTDSLVLVTDDSEYRELRVPLTVTRRAAGFAPEQLDLRLATGQNAASGLVRLRTADDKQVVIDRIEPENRDLRVKWAAGPGSMATLRLGVELQGAPTSGMSSVKVYLKEPKEQVIVIPISWQGP